MAGSQDYQLQLEALRELESLLRRIDEEFSVIMSTYCTTVGNLFNRGLPIKDHTKVMEEFYRPSQNHVNQCQNITREQAIPYVRHQIQGLEQLLNR